ncbi:MAG TPA: 1-acyl-sn-glycerol-3-phosphate acyltransferase [Acidobacteriota bacterium]|nr:1-acyl-sn-glycerol-3-phosphate acyltransferase [Acidobacteriota bacterium]
MNNLRKKSFYPYVLDHKPGFFLGWLLYTLFKRVHFDENMAEELKRMHRQGTVVYAIKYRGHLDYLLYHYRFRRSRLPYPKIAFDMNISMLLPLSQFLRVLKFHIAYFIKRGALPSPFKTGFFKEAIQKGTTSLLCLVDPKGFTRHFIYAEKDNLHFLLETQKGMERPIYIVPQLVLYKKTPEKDYSNLFDIFFGFKEKPGFIRKIGLFFRHNRQAFIDFGRPLNLKAYIEGQSDTRPMEEMAVEIRHMLIDSIDRQKRVILGPVMKSRQQFKEKVLKDAEIIRTIEHAASGNIKQLKQLRKKAGEYFDEIAADYNIAYVQFFEMALTWFWKKIFKGIDIDIAELALLREWARRGPLVYVPSHKSHIDYLVLNYVLLQHHMHIPRVAAGKNMAFWPMGHVFRKSGAFFIRRTFKGPQLYPAVFTRYIKALLEEGHPLEFFIEGGRSRSGKLTLPKIGFLSILLHAYKEGYCDDLVFVPASISYDRILEEKSHLKELWGGEKKKESLVQILKARHFLKTRYGKAYIRFGHPISLKEYLTQEGYVEGKTHRHLGFHIIQSINKVTLVTPLAVIASAILTKHRRGFSLPELTATAELLLGFLERYHILTATTLKNFEKTRDETLSLLISRKVVNVLQEVDEEETFYYVDEDKKGELEYYKNSIIHYFISHAFVAVSMLTGTEEVTSREEITADYSLLKNILKNEFVYDEEKDIQEKVDGITSYFLDSAFITRTNANGGYRLTRLGYDRLPIFAALAKTFLESYWIATRSFIHLKTKHPKSSDLLKNMNNRGVRFHKMGLIDHIEAVSQVNFKNAIDFISKNILLSHEKHEEAGPEAWEKLSRLSQKLYDLSHFRA